MPKTVTEEARAFSHALFAEPSIAAVLDRTWSRLEPSLTRLFTLHISDNNNDAVIDGDNEKSAMSVEEPIKEWLTPELFMELYTTVFEYCVAEPVEFAIYLASNNGAVGGRKEDEDKREALIDREYVLYTRLYCFIENTLTEWCHRISSAASSTITTAAAIQGNAKPFERAFLSASVRFKEAIKHVEAVFLYVERHWFEKAILDGEQSLFPQVPITRIMEMGRRTWEESVLAPLLPLVCNAVDARLSVARQGQGNNFSIQNGILHEREVLIDPVVTELMFAYKNMSTAGIVIRSRTASHRINALEAHYRDQLVSHCRDMAFSSDDVHAIEQASAVWRTEVKLAEAHLGSSAYIQSVLKVALLDPLLPRILACFRHHVVSMVTVTCDADMSVVKSIYGLLRTRKALLQQLDRAFEAAITQRGALLSHPQPTAQSMAHIGDALVRALLSEHALAEHIVLEIFEGRPEASQARDRAFRSFMNTRADIRRRLPEALARFFDYLFTIHATADASSAHQLAKSSSIESVVSGRLVPSILYEDSRNGDIELRPLLLALFRMLDDKDVFQRHYTRLLAQRIVYHHRVYGDQSSEEHALLASMRDICGIGFVTPMLRLLADADSSTHLTEHYRRSSTCKEDVSFLVLPHGSYTSQAPMSLQANPLLSSFPLSTQQSIVTDFSAYYLGLHQGRRLQWLPELSTADIAAEFAGTGRRHTFTVKHAPYILTTCCRCRCCNWPYSPASQAAIVVQYRWKG